MRTSSAGTHALVGHPIDHRAAAVLEKLGGDASRFAARRLTPRIIEGADLILAMTMHHREAILELAPQRLHRVFTLAEASSLVSKCGAQCFADLRELRPYLSTGDVVDVVDPINQGAEIFAMVGDQIAEMLPPILELCRRAGEFDCATRK